jgi:hypothetical protein
MPTLKTAQGFSIETFPSPPTGFDLGAASVTERSRYGLSIFTDDQALQSRWQSKLTGYQFIQPLFSSRTIAPKTIASLDTAISPHTTHTWSGAIVPTGPANPVVWIEGNWTVPAMSLPVNAAEGRIYAASPWIGIDGDGGSRDVLQAGCDAEVTLMNGAPSARYRLWYEWYPGDSNYIPNLPITAGDALAAIIKLQPGSNNSAAVLLTNQSKRIACNFTLTAINGFALVGNCAEWIVESNPQLGALGNYGTVNFTSCAAGLMSGATATAGNAIPVVMVDAYNHVLSAGQIAGPDLVRVSYVQT